MARGLWRDPDFFKLWLGQTVSKFGSGITGSALSLAAVLVLGASATQMGLLSAAAILPLVVLGLFAGVWVDRLRRRPVLIWADLGRALILLTVPAAALAGQLSLAQLFLVAAGTGALTVIFDVAYQAYVPDLVGRRRVLEANSKLAASEALAEVTTPGLAGLLVALISAPMAVLLDAVSFVFSALCIALVRRPEAPEPARPAGSTPAPTPPRPAAGAAKGSRTCAGRSGRGCAWWPATPTCGRSPGTPRCRASSATSSGPSTPSSSCRSWAWGRSCWAWPSASGGPATCWARSWWGR